MASINKVILIGNLGKDPEVRQLPSGGAVANVTVATNEVWKDKQTGEQQERTEWHTVVFFGRLAEIAGEYLRKGRPVYVEGSLRTRKWQDKNGVDRYTTEIVASEMKLLGSREGSNAPAEPRDAPQSPARTGGGAGAPAPDRDFEDNIPFVRAVGAGRDRTGRTGLASLDAFEDGIDY